MKVTLDVSDKLPKQKANSLHETFSSHRNASTSNNMTTVCMLANVEDLTAE